MHSEYLCLKKEALINLKVKYIAKMFYVTNGNFIFLNMQLNPITIIFFDNDRNCNKHKQNSFRLNFSTLVFIYDYKSFYD